MTTTSGRDITTGTRPVRVRGVASAVDRDQVVDAGAVVVLASLALAGFRGGFGGTGFLVIGLTGTVAGLGASWISTVRRWDPVLTLAAVVGAFFLLGGIAVPHVAIAGFLPGPAVPAALLRGLVHGWIDSVTTADPVGTGGGIGVVPYACGFGCGVAGGLLALRSSLVLIPAVPAFGVLCVSILFGIETPVSLLAQGGIFTAVALGWGAVRANRPRRSVDGHVYWPRVWHGSIMLLVVGAAGLLIGGILPGVDANGRYYVRQSVEPPFDPRERPSPLGSFRAYQKGDPKKAVQFRVTGLPAGESLRLATMDTYDGVVWVVGGPASSGSGRFERVGTSIRPAPPGRAVTLTVEVAAYRGLWVPGIGKIRSLRFTGGSAGALSSDFRFNAETGDGAVRGEMGAGASYVVEARIPPSLKGWKRAALANLVVDPDIVLPELPELPEALQKKARALVAGKTSPYDKAKQIEAVFRQGFYSDGDRPDNPAARSAPGHSIRRLGDFLRVDQKHPVGNAEQYAAAMAVVARYNGLPARVVMGFTVPAKDRRNGGPLEITGDHVDAWVEIAFDGVGWQSFRPTPRKDREPKRQDPVKEREVDLDTQPPPKSRYLQPPDLRSEQDSKKDKKKRREAPPALGAGLPRFLVVGMTSAGGTVLVVALLAGAVILAKSSRRRRRRSHGSPADRVSAAWREVVDGVRDLGVAVPARGTRREVAGVVPVEIWSGAHAVAGQVDEVVFGARVPDDGAAESVWTDVDLHLAEMRRPLSRSQRIRSAVSLASFRRPR